jgi:uncharacterized protein
MSTHTTSSAGFRIDRVCVPAPGLPAGATPLRLAQLSDLHLRAIHPRHERLLAALDDWAPDAILLTGDYVSRSSDTWTLMTRLMERLHAPHGVYACRGNWEVKNDAPCVDALRRMCADVGVTLLVNESRVLPLNGAMLRIVGLDDIVLGWPDITAALDTHGQDVDCTVVLAHAPLSARLLPHEADVDLVLSGHTHGGQIRVPWLWRRLLPRCTGGLSDGLHRVAERWVYVNRGFGYSGPLHMRFRCPAEVTFLTVEPVAVAP